MVVAEEPQAGQAARPARLALAPLPLLAELVVPPQLMLDLVVVAVGQRVRLSEVAGPVAQPPSAPLEQAAVAAAALVEPD